MRVRESRGGVCLFLKMSYNFIAVPVLYLGLSIISLFNRKLRKSVHARSGIIENLLKRKLTINPYKTTVLFHCSSMGEYKQIIPVVKNLFEKQKEISYNVVLSLYSPSAYEHIDKKNPWFSIITYTPFDFYFETKRFINTINPDIVLISKHDVWPNFIWELKKRDVPVFLINGLFADDTKMDRWYAKPFFSSLFSGLTGIMTINEMHRQRFCKIYPYPEKIIVSGDTRFDAVICESELPFVLELMNTLKSTEKVFIAGSSWPTGEKYILKAWERIKQKHHDAFLILVPHDIGADHIYKLESMCQEKKFRTAVMTEMEENEKLSDFDVLIVDKIGLLTKLYRYGSIAYVGGGFSTSGIHSVLEPAVYGLPVMFGPNLEKSPEAQEMNKLNCGMIFNNDTELYSLIDSLWSDKELYRRISEISTGFIKDRSGATAKIIETIKANTQKPNFDKKISMTEEEFEKMMREENKER
jgi:3-deoxy-D-manno-octulosonic-acid transferase